MIYLDFLFKDYEGFKQIFGLRECGNGSKSRMNKILLTGLKDRKFVRGLRSEGVAGKYGAIFMTDVRDLSTLKDFVKYVIKRSSCYREDSYPSLLDFKNGWKVRSCSYLLDSFGGICEDGTVNYVRYVRDDDNRVYKMKAGKFLNKCMDDMSYYLPESFRRWIEEEFSREWTAHVCENNSRYDLVVDDDFESIYDSERCPGDFCSCMVDDRQYTFYNDAVVASAASLRDDDNYIVARCVVFNEVWDENGNKYRLAERQYARGGDNSLKQQLVNALIRGGYIDGYKTVGADCHDSRNYVSNTGESLRDKRFRIRCNLYNGDTLSYQDSFKYYDYDDHTAYNYGSCCYTDELDDTEDTFYARDRHYSEYNSEYLSDDDAYYVARHDDYYTRNQVVSVNDEWEFIEDVEVCDQCGEYVLRDKAYYSELTEKYYCDEECACDPEEQYKSENWYWSDYDEEYFEDESELVEYLLHISECDAHEKSHMRYSWYRDTNSGLYFDGSYKIYKETLAYLVAKGKAAWYCGKAYVGGIDSCGLPDGINLSQTLEMWAA